MARYRSIGRESQAERFYFLLEMSPSPPPVRRKNFSQSSRGRKSKSSASESFTRCQHNKTIFFITEALRGGGKSQDTWRNGRLPKSQLAKNMDQSFLVFIFGLTFWKVTISSGTAFFSPV
jgi:hypothetical protein